MVENQLYEFKLIIANMAKYDYYPSVDEFKDFLDNIKIFLELWVSNNKTGFCPGIYFSKIKISQTGDVHSRLYYGGEITGV